jgi:phosphatidylglycerol lysyltransferase
MRCHVVAGTGGGKVSTTARPRPVSMRSPTAPEAAGIQEWTTAPRSARLVRWLGPTLVLAVLALALASLEKALHAFRYHDVVRSVRALPPTQTLLAVVLTVLAYGALAGYDALAFAYVGRRVPARRICLGSFVSYAISQTLGFPLLTGGSVRYRLWSAWGLSTLEIATALGFIGAAFTTGLLLTTGAALLFEPIGTAALLRIPSIALRAIGAICLGIVAAYLVWCATRRAPLRLRGWELPTPPVRLAILQLLVAAADWTLAASVLYALLPRGHGIAFLPFLGAFLIAQLAGILSHVPGGLGVFDALLVLFLAPYVPAPPALAALVAYRAVYYLLPFALGLGTLAAYEAARQRRHIGAAAARVAGAADAAGRQTARVAGRVAGRWTPAVLPTVLGIATFAAGVVLLLSGAAPGAHSRLRWLTGVLPLGVVEFSHFVGSVAGVGLLVLGWALTRRLDAAYGLAAALLATGIGASLLKGLHWGEALALGLVLGALLPSRHAFYRKAALTTEPLTPGWIAAIVAVVGGAVWLGLFSYRHVAYSQELWWQFTVRGDAPRFLRATAGSVGALLALGLTRLLRLAPARPAPPRGADLDRAAAIARCAPEVGANLALLGDKALLFSPGGDGFLMYGVEGRSWVALGDPIGPAEVRAELAWQFREAADRHGGWTVFYEVGTENLPLYIDLGLTLLKLGEEALVRLTDFSLDGATRRSLRRAHGSVAKRGATFEVVPPSAVPALLPELRAVSDDWLRTKHTREKGFSLGRFDDAYLCRFPMALVRVAGRTVAFANVWVGAAGTELSPDLMRHSADAPHGVMEYLFVELMLWGRQQGYCTFNLGMAPLSGLEHRQLAPLWTRAGSLLYQHGEHFYNFQGLRQYKEKYDPDWRPRYLASPGGFALPRILANLSALISGGLTGVVAR